MNGFMGQGGLFGMRMGVPLVGRGGGGGARGARGWGGRGGDGLPCGPGEYGPDCAVPEGGALYGGRMGQEKPADQRGRRPLPGEQVLPSSLLPLPVRSPAADADRVQAREDRLCDMLRRFASDLPSIPEESDARTRIFWSFVRAQGAVSGQGEDAVIAAVRARCPDIEVPAKPARPAEMKPPASEGFHGKTRLSFDEAKELSDVLEVVLTPLTPEEAAKELAREECLREIVRADGFPIVERLEERLKDFVATAKPTDTFEISHGETVVTGKAVECAQAIGRAKTIRAVVTTGGVAAGGAGLLWLLGLL